MDTIHVYGLYLPEWQVKPYLDMHELWLEWPQSTVPEFREQKPEVVWGVNMVGTLGPPPKTFLPSYSSGPVMGGATLNVSEMLLGSFFYCLLKT